MIVMAIVIAVIWGVAIVTLVLGVRSTAVERLLQRRLDQELQRMEEDESLIQQQEAAELHKPLAQRLFMPLLERMGKVTGKQTSALVGPQAQELLAQAGYPWGMNVVHFTGMKLLLFAAFAGFALLISPRVFGFLNTTLIDLAPFLEPYRGNMKYLGFAFLFLMADMGLMLPVLWLRRLVGKRRAHIKRAMADTVDLIVLGLEAGLGFDGAVGQSVENMKSPLADELARVLAEVNTGKAQSDAWRDMAERIKMEELSLLVAAVDQSMKLGVGMASALRLQATELRERRMAWAKEQAAKLPVKMLFPLIFFIFPALFIVILGPAGLQAMEVFKDGGLLGQ